MAPERLGAEPVPENLDEDVENELKNSAQTDTSSGVSVVSTKHGGDRHPIQCTTRRSPPPKTRKTTPCTGSPGAPHTGKRNSLRGRLNVQDFLKPGGLFHPCRTCPFPVTASEPTTAPIQKGEHNRAIAFGVSAARNRNIKRTKYRLLPSSPIIRDISNPIAVSRAQKRLPWGT